MTKDYILLANYLHSDTIYNVFETAGVVLTASFELRGKELVREVTLSRKLGEEKAGIISYSKTNVQRAVLTRVRKTGKPER